MSEELEARLRKRAEITQYLVDKRAFREGADALARLRERTAELEAVVQDFVDEIPPELSDPRLRYIDAQISPDVLARARALLDGRSAPVPRDQGA